jgi:hypothetical protein
MIELGELFTVRVLPTVRAVTWPATGFMPLGRTWARRSAAPGQKLSSEHAVRACTSRRGEVRGRPAAARLRNERGTGRRGERCNGEAMSVCVVRLVWLIGRRRSLASGRVCRRARC